jgi:methionine sulfoxide reductase heme-binding subunit
VKDPTFWFIARASGLTAYALLSASVLMGLLVKARPVRRLKQASVTDTHRFLAVMGLGMVALHGVALVLDSTVHIRPLGLLVPGLISYRPLATSIGVVSAELMLLVYVSFALRKRIGLKNWRRLHWVTYGIFGAATVHGLASGTDSGQPWAVGLYLTALGLVTAAIAWRALVPRPVPVSAQGGSR